MLAFDYILLYEWHAGRDSAPPPYTLEPRVLRDARWLAAGNPSELALYPGGIHTFNAFPIALAQKANNRIGEFIRHAEYRNY
jgi:acetyl esterase/lipase